MDMADFWKYLKTALAHGGLTAYSFTEDGLITEMVFYGDVCSVTPLDELTEALKGCAFRQENAVAVLGRFPLAELFVGIHKEEILDTMFRAEKRGRFLESKGNGLRSGLVP